MMLKYRIPMSGPSALIVAALAFTMPVRAADVETSATREVKAGPLTLIVPESWTQEPPANRLRLAQFVIPAAESDEDGAELVLSGPFGGSAQQNIQRWIGQFDAEGRKLKMTQGETEQGKYILVDLLGTYNKTVGPPIRRQTKSMPGSRMLGVMFMAKGGGNYFFKMAGPEKTVTSHVDGLRTSFGGDATQETEYSLD